MGGKRIEAVVQAFQSRHLTPSVVGAHVTPEQIQIAGAGASTETSFAWFSCSKLVTVAAALGLQNDGRLDLKEPVGRWLPETAKVGPSVRDLLRHRAGLPNPIPLGWIVDASKPPLAPSAFFRRHGEGPARRAWRAPFEPRFRYSNLSYLVAGEALQRAAKVDFRDLVKDRVLTPLGMNRTDFGPAVGSMGSSAAPPADGHMVYGSPYDLITWAAGASRVSRGRRGRWRRLGPTRMQASAAGGLFGPVGEAGRFLQAWLTDEIPGAAAALRAAPGEPFGMGWWIAPDTVHHGGTGLGFVAHTVLDPARRRAAVAFANRSGARGPDWPPIESLTRTLLDP